MSHEHSPDITIQFTQEFWDDRYRSAGQLWSGQPNPQLVGQTAGLAPGEALDVGCGEGADAIWLASQGWTVTALDISAVALDRAAAHAAARGEQIARRISWRQADLLSWDAGSRQFDLVSAQFMYLPEAELQSLHRRLAAAYGLVAPCSSSCTIPTVCMPGPIRIPATIPISATVRMHAARRLTLTPRPSADPVWLTRVPDEPCWPSPLSRSGWPRHSMPPPSTSWLPMS